METESFDSSKSFDPQLLPEGSPTSEWGFEHLNVYAQLQYRQILDGEKSATAIYWRLGCALVYAKKAFKHGRWVQHLKNLGIDKTRASKARAIYSGFKTEVEVAGLRVDEAYERRKRKQGKKPIPGGRKNIAVKRDAKMLRKSIGCIAKRTGSVIHTAAYAEPKDAARLIPAVRKAIDDLEELLQFLEEQAAKAPPDEQATTPAAPQPPVMDLESAAS